MSKVQMLRALVNQRLSAAAEEIFALFERTIAEYEEEIGRQRSLLREAGRPGSGAAAFPTNVTNVTVAEEVPPVQQLWSPSPDQEDPEPPHVKEERHELSTGRYREGEQLQGPEEADITGFPSVPVKTEEEEEEEEEEDDDDDDDEVKSLHPEENREATGAGNSHPARRSHPGSNKTSNSSETEDGDDDLVQIREPQSGVSALRNNASRHGGHDAATKPFDAGRRAGEKAFTCPFCGKKFTKSSNLTTHLRVHTGEKPFTCSVCNTSFSLRCTLVNHMRVHTGEKPFGCSVCSKRFSKKANLTTHMALHTEEKPFRCSACGKRFTWHSQVKNHKCAV